MGYCARDGSGDGRAHYMPRVSSHSSALVSDAGSPEVDGTYSWRGTHSEKNYYNSIGQPDDPSTLSIRWGGSSWGITGSGGDAVYSSIEDVLNPWDVNTWSRDTGSDPAPTVTEI